MLSWDKPFRQAILWWHWIKKRRKSGGKKFDAIEDARTDGAFADALAEIDIQILATELEQLRRQSPADETAIALKELEIETAQLNLSLEQELRAMELERMNSELETLETQLVEGTLYAPFDGRILFGQPIEKGSGVTAYDPILYLADDSRLSITADYISSTYTDSADEIYAWIGAKQYEITPTPIDMSEYFVTAAFRGNPHFPFHL